MLKFSSKVLMIFFIAGLTISCDQQDASPQHQKKSLNELMTDILSSQEFIELEVNVSDLRKSGIHFTNKHQDGVVIPFNGQDGKKGVMAIFNNDQQILKVAIFEDMTDLTTDQVAEQMTNNTFNGSFRIIDGSGSLEVRWENSKVVSSSVNKRQGRVAGCGDATSNDGALACAGARIEQLNWFDKTICYIVFGECFAQMVISCIIDNCVVNPSMAP